MCIRDSRRALGDPAQRLAQVGRSAHERDGERVLVDVVDVCLLYTSDAADERSSVDLGGRRIIKTKNRKKKKRDCTRG